MDCHFLHDGAGKVFSILLYGHDRAALARQQVALTEAGFEVEAVTTKRQAEKLVRRRRHDAIILGYSLQKTDRNQVAALFKQANPHGYIVMTYAGSIDATELADAVLSFNAPASDIVQTLQHLFERTPARQGGR